MKKMFARQCVDVFLPASNYEKRVFLVSETLASFGLSDGIYPSGSLEIQVKNVIGSWTEFYQKQL